VISKQEQQPPEEEPRELAPGIIRLQLPVDMPGLGHVNAYAIRDRGGVSIVDPGVPGDRSWEALMARLRDAGLSTADVETILITHSHPDHFGGAHRLAAQTGAVVITHGAWRTRLWPADGQAAPCGDLAELPDIDPADVAPANPWEEPLPWGGESMASGWRRRLADAGSEDQARDWMPPEPDRGVADGERLKLAGREWSCLYTPGHTLDHLCLYDPQTGTLLSGDHVLPTITPHIAGIGSGRDPLSSYLASLDRVAGVGPVSVVLPAHGQPFADLPDRVAAIKRHHEERLERVGQILEGLGRATVAEASHHLFRPDLWGPMAESEAYAHLEHLRLAGALRRSRRDDGLLEYTLTTAGRT
jgi:glyoxylase-like metal-dependent hydrolase (beta-lactamase superfamily II)